MTTADRKYVTRVVADVFAFMEGIVLPSIDDVPPDLGIRFAIRNLTSFRAGIFRSAVRPRYDIYVTIGLALETYAAIRSLPAKEKRFLKKQFPNLTSSRTRDFQSGFTFVCALGFVISHELSHVLAGHVDFFRQEVERPPIGSSEIRSDATADKSKQGTQGREKRSAAVSKIREIEADGFATFIVHEFRQEFAASCVDDAAIAKAFASGTVEEADLRGMTRLSLFGMLLFAILLERHHEESDARVEKHGFAHARLVYICVGHVLLERPDLAHYDSASKQILFDPADRERLTEYFALDVLPVLICCQRAADAAGIPLNIVPIAANPSNSEPSLVSEIAAIISGQEPGRTEGGEQLARLGRHLTSWYEGVEAFRQVRTHT